MLRWQAVVETEAASRLLWQQKTELLLRISQKLERVDNVGKVGLHLVVLARHENQLVCLELICDEHGLLSLCHHEAQSYLLVVVRGLVPEKVTKCLCRFLVRSEGLLLLIVLPLEEENEASCQDVQLVWLDLVDHEVAPAEQSRDYLVYHVAEDECVFSAQLVQQVSEQTCHLNLAKFLVELGGQVAEVDEPASHILVLVKWRLSRVCHMLHYHEGHHV